MAENDFFGNMTNLATIGVVGVGLYLLYKSGILSGIGSLFDGGSSGVTGSAVDNTIGGSTLPAGYSAVHVEDFDFNSLVKQSSSNLDYTSSGGVVHGPLAYVKPASITPAAYNAAISQGNFYASIVQKFSSASSGSSSGGMSTNKPAVIMSTNKPAVIMSTNKPPAASSLIFRNPFTGK